MTYEEAGEIAEKIADEEGIYGIIPGKLGNHPDNCKCRICFVTSKINELMNE